MFQEPSFSTEAKANMLDALPAHGEVIEDLPQLVTVMGNVALATPGVDLAHLRYGLRAYQRVTEAVNEEAEAGHFDDPDKMLRTMPRFAKRIFDPIERHTLGDTAHVGPWSRMFYSPAAKRALPSTSMVDFLGFHVLYDLPFTLYETGTEPRHKKDYSSRINTILRRVGDELHHEYIALHPMLEKARVTELGIAATMTHLMFSRDLAWRSFKMIEAVNGPYDERVASLEQPSPTLRRIDGALALIATKAMLSTKKAPAFAIGQFSRVPEGVWDFYP